MYRSVIFKKKGAATHEEATSIRGGQEVLRKIKSKRKKEQRSYPNLVRTVLFHSKKLSQHRPDCEEGERGGESTMTMVSNLNRRGCANERSAQSKFSQRTSRGRSHLLSGGGGRKVAQARDSGIYGYNKNLASRALVAVEPEGCLNPEEARRAMLRRKE